MNLIQDVSAADLHGALTETKTEQQEYRPTDSQISDTASVQYEFLSGENSVFTL